MLYQFLQGEVFTLEILIALHKQGLALTKLLLQAFLVRHIVNRSKHARDITSGIELRIDDAMMPASSPVGEHNLQNGFRALTFRECPSSKLTKQGFIFPVHAGILLELQRSICGIPVE